MQKKEKRMIAALDKFPAGIVLIVLVIVVVILQTISAVKVIGLEGERRLLERDKEKHKHLPIAIESLETHRDELDKEIIARNEKLNTLKIKLTKITDDYDNAVANIRLAEKMNPLISSLEATIRSLDDEIKTKTEEVKRLTGPMSKLSETVDDLGDVPGNIEKVLKNFESAIKKVKESSDSMDNQTSKTLASLKRITDDLNIAEKESRDASLEVAEAAGTIKEATKSMNKHTEEFKQASRDISGSMDDIKDTTRKLSDVSDDIQQAGKQTKDIVNSLKSTNKDLDDVIDEIRGNVNAFNAVQREVDKLQISSSGLSELTRKIKKQSTEFNNKITDIKPSQYDSNFLKYRDDIAAAASTATQLEGQLKNIITRIKGLTDESAGQFKLLQEEIEEANKRINKMESPINNDN